MRGSPGRPPGPGRRAPPAHHRPGARLMSGEIGGFQTNGFAFQRERMPSDDWPRDSSGFPTLGETRALFAEGLEARPLTRSTLDRAIHEAISDAERDQLPEPSTVAVSPGVIERLYRGAGDGASYAGATTLWGIPVVAHEAIPAGHAFIIGAQGVLEV